MYQRDNANILTIKYNIDESVAGEKDVKLYAEISDKPEFPDIGAFMLDVYMGIESYGLREHVVGLGFGEKSMDKASMIAFVDSIIDGQLKDNFHSRVKSFIDFLDLLNGRKM